MTLTPRWCKINPKLFIESHCGYNLRIQGASPSDPRQITYKLMQESTTYIARAVVLCTSTPGYILIDTAIMWLTNIPPLTTIVHRIWSPGPTSLRTPTYTANSKKYVQYDETPNPTSHNHWRNERSEEHTSELQSHSDLVCRLLLEKKKKKKKHNIEKKQQQ